MNQETIRADLYQHIRDRSLENLGYTIGKRIVLPSSFKGSPRNLSHLFQDAMAVVKEFGKPDYFVTITCNPNWPEINNELKGVQNSDKLTIIATMFKIKLRALMYDLIKNKIAGNVKVTNNFYYINMYVLIIAYTFNRLTCIPLNSRNGAYHMHMLFLLWTTKASLATRMTMI